MKRFIIFFVLIAIAAVALFLYLEYNRTNADLKTSRAQFSMEATELIAAFDTDTASASKKYTDKVIEVSGVVKSIDTYGNPVVISMGRQGDPSSVKCSMDSSYARDYENVQEGDELRIKGMCNGGTKEGDFGTDVSLNRCVLISKKS
jgi:hypothetical protein